MRRNKRYSRFEPVFFRIHKHQFTAWKCACVVYFNEIYFNLRSGRCIWYTCVYLWIYMKKAKRKKKRINHINSFCENINKWKKLQIFCVFESMRQSNRKKLLKIHIYSIKSTIEHNVFSFIAFLCNIHELHQFRFAFQIIIIICIVSDCYF